jgi:hypothetical protein
MGQTGTTVLRKSEPVRASGLRFRVGFAKAELQYAGKRTGFQPTQTK